MKPGYGVILIWPLLGAIVAGIVARFFIKSTLAVIGVSIATAAAIGAFLYSQQRTNSTRPAGAP